MGQNGERKDLLFEVNFSVVVSVSDAEISQVRSANRNFLSSGLFKKDINIAQVIAHNKAVEAVTKLDPSVQTSILAVIRPDINFNIEENQL